MILGRILGSCSFNFANLKLVKAENQYHFRLLYKPTKLRQKASRARDCVHERFL